jgi:exosortase
MDLPVPNPRVRRLPWFALSWVPLAVAAALLTAPVAEALLRSWRVDPSLSHGPLVPLIALGLLWTQREALRGLCTSAWGLVLLFPSCLVYVLAMWAGFEVLKPLSLIGMAMGAVWYLCGWRIFSAAAGPLGFLVFMIPWPTTLVERVAFPLQITSSAYSAMLGGLLGVPVYREGVQMWVIPDPTQPPIYAMVVAQQCSGLTSLMVLLALGYLVAYLTPLKLGWRALLVGIVVPLTLLANTVRLTLILLAGAYYSEAMATWVHDHEAPVLIFFCSLGLLSLRAGLLRWTQPGPPREENIVAPAPIIAG